MLALIECDPYSPVLEAEPVDVTLEPFFNDLERLYSREDLLPAAAGRVVAGQLKVTMREEYIAWARLLGKPARVLLLSESESPESLGSEVRVISSQEAREEEEAMYPLPSWQLYRFVRPLSEAERSRFADTVRRALSATGRARLCSTIDFFDQDRAAEFMAFLPPYDDESRRELQTAVFRYSVEDVRILAFNGHRFGPR